MLRLLSSLFLASLCAANTVPIKFMSTWGTDTARCMQANCTVTLPNPQPKGDWNMRLVLDKETSNLEIWKMNNLSSEQNGKIYNLESRYNFDGITTVSFIVTYVGTEADHPTGYCVSAFNDETVPDPDPGNVGTTTLAPQPTTATPTTTTARATTTTTTQATTSTPALTTKQAATTPGVASMTVPVVTSAHWGPVNGVYKMEGHCTFQIDQDVPKFYVRIEFNKETTAFQEWHVSIIDQDANGLWYYTENNSPGSTPYITFNFHIDYFTGNHPDGVCILILPGGQGQSTTTSPGQGQSSTTTPAPSTTTTRATTTTTTTTTRQTTTTTGGNAQTTTQSPPTSVNTRYDYRELLHKSILFYEAQRSGDLPASNRIPYRGDSSVDDQGEFGEDLSGGWHDAGDHVKFNFPMASSTTLLSLGLHLFKDAYTDAGELDLMYDSIKWPLDYFLKCWRENSNRYYATVADPYADHAYWGRPEDMTMNRPAYFVDASKPGSDVGAETAAAMAAGALAFASKDPAYSNTLRQKAESLYAFSKSNRGLYSNSIPIVAEFYSSGADADELCESAALLYLLTGNNQYLSDAESFHPDYTAWSLSWDEKTVLCQVLLMNITGKNVYKSRVSDFLNSYMNGGIPKTPCGLTYRLEWGSLRYAANAAYVAVLAAETGRFSAAESNNYRRYAMTQIHYALGDNKYDRSYVVGFGNNPPLRPHHRAASCPSTGPCSFNQLNTPDPNPQVLYGAMVGGPDVNDNYQDVRTDFQRNEVATDYNAGFQSAIAGLQSFALRGTLPAAPAKGC